jgi:hypothetical protein
LRQFFLLTFTYQLVIYGHSLNSIFFSSHPSLLYPDPDYRYLYFLIHFLINHSPVRHIPSPSPFSLPLALTTQHQYSTSSEHTPLWLKPSPGPHAEWAGGSGRTSGISVLLIGQCRERIHHLISSRWEHELTLNNFQAFMLHRSQQCCTKFGNLSSSVALNKSRGFSPIGFENV